MKNLIESYYDRSAEELAQKYETIDPADIYQAALGYFPASPSTVLDVAAGSGRDAAWLRRMGHRVTAVEPSEGMRTVATRLHPDNGIEWIDSRLPALPGVERPAGGFALILAGAVWMHLEDGERQAAWERLAELAAPGAAAVVTLRHGPCEPERPMHPIDDEMEAARAMKAGFSSARVFPDGHEGDLLGRSEVTWKTLVATR